MRACVRGCARVCVRVCLKFLWFLSHFGRYSICKIQEKISIINVDNIDPYKVC